MNDFADTISDGSGDDDDQHRCPSCGSSAPLVLVAGEAVEASEEGRQWGFEGEHTGGVLECPECGWGPES